MFWGYGRYVHISVVPCPDSAQTEGFLLESLTVDRIDREAFSFDRQSLLSSVSRRFSEQRPRAQDAVLYNSEIEVRSACFVPVHYKFGKHRTYQVLATAVEI